MTDAEPSNMYIDQLKEHRCYSLHDERFRGATWYDRKNNVVFLLAYGLHDSGARGDFYAWIAQLEQRGNLYPTAGGEDYANLAIYRKDRELRDLRRRSSDIVDAAIDGAFPEIDLDEVRAILMLSERGRDSAEVRLRLDRKPGCVIGFDKAALIAESMLGLRAVQIEVATDFRWQGELVGHGSWVFRALINLDR